MNLNELDLADKDVEVLRVVANHGDRGVTTSEVVGVVGWASKGENHKVTYRFDKLEERGFIATRQESERGEGNQIDPRVAYVTEEGAGLAEDVEFDPSNAPMEERLERLESQVKPIRETYGEIKKRVADLEKKVEEHDEDLDGLAEEIENVKRAMDAGAPEKDEGGMVEFGDD